MAAILSVAARGNITGIDNAMADAIRAAYTYANPEFERRERRGLWTGDTAQTVETWTAIPHGVSVPRGAGPRIVGLLRQHNVLFQVVDNTIAPSMHVAITPIGELRAYQQQALDLLVGRRSGVCVAPTGSGKTNILLSAIAVKKTTAIVVVHTKELLRQTADRCRSWLGFEPGIIGDGQWDIRPITIASVQTLSRRDLRSITSQFGLVAVDEAHHAPARQWSAVLDQFPARYRYGFSATPWRKDGLGFLLDDHIGPVIATVTPEAVRAAGATVPVRVETVYTTWQHTLRDRPDAWSAMLTALADDAERNRLITDLVRERYADGATLLVLTDRVAHAQRLADGVHDLEPVLLTGELSSSARETRMQAVRDGARLTIATAAMLGEGVDAPGWDCLLLATPFAGGPRTTQAVGRVVRPAPGKRDATVIDLVDRLVPALQAAAYARRRLYAEAA